MYEMNITLDMPFDAALDKVREILMANHLGVVSDVDVQAIFKNKMDKDIPAYHIYGACNPKLADRVITAEPNAGTLLPCNFIMREEGDKTVVSFMDPVAVLGLSEAADVRAVAEEARTMIERAIQQLQD
ncbi:DUF302 domain-containing protein [Thiolapillus brandeum]|uniref:DUF302 domain-containing protein n=1 Tax=Thiolapillus brandeum TaxID=1076588 RepID=A0A7U6GH52_9GAMM|nr:DUF302 domain-containing protein [Thiolapillus brandeum]BAO43549.1 conserved hypothetical protein [Thiolapillus brandeum]